jgi:hypothetical protein
MVREGSTARKGVVSGISNKLKICRINKLHGIAG